VVLSLAVGAVVVLEVLLPVLHLAAAEQVNHKPTRLMALLELLILAVGAVELMVTPAAPVALGL
jgi:hypothetical protein